MSNGGTPGHNSPENGSGARHSDSAYGADPQQAAFVAHPELRHLAELRDSGGWTFRHYDSEPEVTELTTGVRVWPDGSADALGIRGESDAQAVRTNPLGELVWKREGDLAFVLNALLELQPPRHPLAPRLVIPGTPPPIWTPQN